MKMRKKSAKPLYIMVTFALIVVGVVLGFQFFTKTGIFHVPGVVYYDDGLNEKELAALQDIFTEEIETRT